MSDLVQREACKDGVALRLTAPRANALEPALLDEIRGHLDGLETDLPDVVQISGGRIFCSGGDVARFAAAVEAGQGRGYALQVVPKLQEIVLRLLALPSVVCVCARGAVTGGGAGLLFASDIAVVAPDCFVQPYYGQVGFAPDGGWTAVLPERIGAGRAMSWLAEDRRVDAPGLVALGLAELGLAELGTEPGVLAPSFDSVRAAKRLIWDSARLALVKSRLEAETNAFLERIDAPETQEGMRRFLHP